jgi:UDP-N-acetylmuramate-alanine ligase
MQKYYLQKFFFYLFIIRHLLAFLLKESGVDCSAFLGGVSVNFDSNYVQGKSDVVVVEADEFDRSFLTLSPDIIVLTSIDTDHLDIYGSREKIVESFQEFIDKLEFIILKTPPLSICLKILIYYF